ncbi:acyl-CoA dehydratase activase-related protein [Mycoplasmatota bacterium WC44]
MEGKYFGIDIGSTTLKVIIIDKNNNVLFKNYVRHYSDIKNTFKNIINEIYKEFGDINVAITLTGSGGINIAEFLEVSFIQEVIASTEALKVNLSGIDVAIELGGEDAKIIYLTDGLEQRMNTQCAGGTGAFIDQIATILKTDAEGINELAKKGKTIYPIASRCGVFAKTDIQALLNEGATKEDIALSVLQAVVIQTITTLAAGRPIKGKVAFLGGPLFFMSELVNRFIETLDVKDNYVLPEDAHYYVALGAAINSKKEEFNSLKEIIKKTDSMSKTNFEEIEYLSPLFNNEDELNEFLERHKKYDVEYKDISKAKGPCFLGIDAGSTTSKIVLIDSDCNIIYDYYTVNEGTPLEQIIIGLNELYEKLPNVAEIKKAYITGYGEEMIKNILNLDGGEVETIAHYKAAKHLVGNVDSIIDIGGQDMKYIKVKNNAIHSIMLNEACSSGCGSFLETYAKSLGLDIKEFANLALLANKAMNFGSRCTVFMNSYIKQAQKVQVSVGDISAGLSYSVIRNALYKVIKLHHVDELGKTIVVQGGTFKNNAVLRALEIETGCNVIRPNISGVMGAFGCALIGKEQYESELRESTNVKSNMIPINKLSELEVAKSVSTCKVCNNKCKLSITELGSNKYISGNRCENGLESIKKVKKNKLPNMYDYKYNRLFNYTPIEHNLAKGVIGIPRAMNMYENYPFWFTYLTSLGFRIELSKNSSKELYEKASDTIPSDTICYPAKLVHGHIKDLVDKNVDIIFYPSVLEETKEFNHSDRTFNCAVVSMYPTTIKINMDIINDNNIEFLSPDISFLHPNKVDRTMYELLKDYRVTKKDIREASLKAWQEHYDFKRDIKDKGDEVLKYLDRNKIKAIVLTGRPYHLDKEVNQGIPNLVTQLGYAVLTEDEVSRIHRADDIEKLRLIDQWAYHSRLYRAADYVKDKLNLELVELTSFGCGLDAVVVDQVTDILDDYNKMNTTIKIDEIKNLGAARIRIRSLIAASKEGEEYIHE